MKFRKAPNILTRRNFLGRSACVGLGAAAATNAIRDLRLLNTAVAATNPTDYKALICVFLGGGNDSNNLIVPMDAEPYGQYTAIRGNLAIPQSALLPLRTGPGGGAPAYVDQDGHTLGFHPACAELQTLFGEDKLAAVFNIGSLVRPITRAEYLANASGTRPPQLFSHSDQVTQWQTSIPDQPPATGWGGRTADILNSVIDPPGNISLSISLAGANTFEVGNLVAQYHVSTAGAVSLSGNLMTGEGARVKAMRALLGLSATSPANHPNLQRKAYADVVENAIVTGDLLNTNIAATTEPPWVWNTPFPTTTLGNQLKMIARLIQARGPFNMKRQIFFCSNGGHDTHTAQVSVNGVNDPTLTNGSHYVLMNTLSEALFAFQRAMEQLGVSDEVTSFTASDFNRTFPTNTQGSDHGWGGHHIVVGGAVNGGQTYGHLPTFAINGPNDTSTGRWIPTLAVDQHAATLAKWFGLDTNDVNMILPNLDRFPTDDLGFMG